MKIVFMGTTDFSVHILQKLYESHYEIIGVFTQPDRSKGRGKKLQSTPVKEFALDHNLPVFTPQTLKGVDVTEFIGDDQPDFLVVAAYGMILPQNYLDWAKIAPINIHTSLLPLYRGAAPVQRAILNRDANTGVSIMKMDAGLDTGAVYKMITIPIENEDTTGTLFEKMAHTGADALVEILPQIRDGLLPVAQANELATYAEKLSKEEEKINWEDSALNIEALSRALQPKPGMYTLFNGHRFKIFDCEAWSENTKMRPGSIIQIEPDAFYVQTGDGILKVMSVQPAGKKRMPVEAFLKGNQHILEDAMFE